MNTANAEKPTLSLNTLRGPQDSQRTQVHKPQPQQQKQKQKQEPQQKQPQNPQKPKVYECDWVLTERARIGGWLMRFNFLNGRSVVARVINCTRYSIEIEGQQIIFKHALRSMRALPPEAEWTGEEEVVDYCAPQETEIQAPEPPRIRSRVRE